MLLNIRHQSFDITKPVYVYRNLTKKCWSIKQNGLVVAHAKEQLTMRDVSFKVNENGRQKVLETKQKNVHAYIKGYLLNESTITFVNKAYYNPYKTCYFVDFETFEPLHTASYCFLTDDYRILYRK